MDTWGELGPKAGLGAPEIYEGLGCLVAKRVLDARAGTGKIAYLNNGMEVEEGEFIFDPAEGDAYVEGSAYAGQTRLAAAVAAAIQLAVAATGQKTWKVLMVSVKSGPQTASYVEQLAPILAHRAAGGRITLATDCVAVYCNNTRGQEWATDARNPAGWLA